MPEQDKRQQEQVDPRIAAIANMLQVEGIKDIEQPEVMYPFSGAWTPTIDATLIGPENFQTLINMRYNDAGIEGVNGYAFRNTTAISTYTKIKSGIHLRTQGRTTENYNLVHAVSSGGQGRVYVNTTDIGSVGDFATGIGVQTAGSKADYLIEDASVDLVGRFSKAPGENVAYCNGENNYLWSGKETTIGSAFTTTSAAEAAPIDVTEKIVNNRTDTTLTIGGSRDYVTILTTRPAQAFKIYVQSANVSASTLAVKYWNGTAYAAVTNASDGTTSGGVALAQTGTVTFDSTISTAKLHHFEDRYLYAYQLYLDAGTADIYQITYEAPPQAPTNVWDGIYRTPIQTQLYTQSTTSYEDYTLHVAESSTVNVPVGCILDGFVAGASKDEMYMMFDEPMAGIRFTMLGNLVNKATTTSVLYYWNGTTWTQLSSAFIDGTSVGSTITFGQSGLMSWAPPTDEEKKTLFSTQGYAYKLVTTGANMTGTKGGTEEVVIDLVTGVPAPKAIPAFKFPVQYKSKLMLCNYEQGNEGNRIDYGLDGNADIFNGENSSLDGYQSIYVGGSEHITCAAQLYNRFGSNLLSSLAIFKNNELYLLTGDSPIDYQLFPVSFKIGCPAPHSLVTAEVGFELGENVARNVAIFVSNGGPMMYDGAVLYPIRGMEKYFDPNEVGSVNFSYLDQARGWFDSTYKEYNMLITTGTSTTLNSWFVYDLVRKKWFQKDVGSTNKVQCGWNVSADNGDQYVYGGTLVGKMLQLETGTSWASTSIDNEIQVADFFPSGNEWDITRIRRLKFVCKRTLENDTNVQYYYYADTNPATGLIVTFVDTTAAYTDSGDAGYSFVDVTGDYSDTGVAGYAWFSDSPTSIDISQSGNTRVVRETNDMNLVGWSHSFRFVYSSTTTPKGLQPLMWGVQYETVRKDY